ncbi:MAG TPA: aldose 1-epimerase [Mycobacterium sp.]|nr:aldose 1-epimerase [Mycobacterium sp.]
MEAITLCDPSSALTATFVPGAGMIGTSLSDDGVELLGQRRGLDAYLRDGKTMGIPILYPWANRLADNHYRAEGKSVTVTPGSDRVRADANGLPIHGTLAGYPGWRLTAQSAGELCAELDFGAEPTLLASFPFPHLLTVAVTVADRTLRVRTTVTATTEAAVPLCFGFHPYLQLPGVPRAEWRIETPALRHLALDGRGIPTGQTSPWPETSETLGEQAFDDGYDEVPPGAMFAVSGGGRRIEVHFDEGYPAAQIFAPAGEELICFEPMAAPTAALCRGGYPVARPGEPSVAQFSIRVA